MQTPFLPGLRYLAEGGQETEIMYGYGFDLPEFALFPLLDSPAAVKRLKSMYKAVLDVAVRHRMGILLGGLDYRASPDWGGLLGLNVAELADYQRRSIAFLEEVAEPYRPNLPHVLISGIVGPQGDAYELNETVTPTSAEAYHDTQMKNLAEANVDLVQAMTFTSTDEAIGVIRAARAHRLPIILSFMPDGKQEENAQPSFREMIEKVDDATENYCLFYGINCSHPREFEPLLSPAGDWLKRVGLLRPNSSAKDKVELCQIGRLERGDPDDLAEQIGTLVAQLPQVTVVGGCCGTWDEHLELIAKALQAEPAARLGK